MSNFTDAKSFIVKAKKISKTRDVQILELLFDMKVNGKKNPNPGNKIQKQKSKLGTLICGLDFVPKTL